MIKSGKSYSYWLARFNRKMSFHFPWLVPLISDRSEWQATPNFHSHFRSDVTSRDLANWRTNIKINRMCPRTDLKVILKFPRNVELLCGVWLLKSFEQREGQRILSLSRNCLEIEAQKGSFERGTAWFASSRREDLATDATEFCRVCDDHFISGS